MATAEIDLLLQYVSFFLFFDFVFMLCRMDTIKAVQLYLEKIVDESGPGMKVLLMDKETVSLVVPFLNHF